MANRMPLPLPPPRKPLGTLPDGRPWWRRIGEWFATGQRIVVACVAICGATTVANVYWKNLIVTSKPILEQAVGDAVKAAMTKEFIDQKAAISILTTNTGGLPEWRKWASDAISAHDNRIQTAEKKVDRCEQRIDTYLDVRVRR